MLLQRQSRHGCQEKTYTTRVVLYSMIKKWQHCAMDFIQGFHPNIGVRNKPNIKCLKRLCVKLMLYKDILDGTFQCNVCLFIDLFIDLIISVHQLSTLPLPPPPVFPKIFINHSKMFTTQLSLYALKLNNIP